MRRVVMLAAVVALGAPSCKTKPPPTPAQRALAAYDACMERNKAKKVCEAEEAEVIRAAAQVFEGLAARHCQSEHEKLTTMEKTSYMLERSAGGLELLRGARAAVTDCVVTKFPQVRGETLQNEYFRSGQAERDAGIVP